MTIRPVETTPAKAVLTLYPKVKSAQGGRNPQSSRHFLFVGAPFGPFSKGLGEALRNEGARCTRILLNAGDLMDWGRRHARVYRGRLSGWPAWLGGYLSREAVTDLIVYGDSNPYCVAAMERARRAGVKIHVFEQGYFRPNWITLERDGVNGSSSLPRDPKFFRQMAKLIPETAHAEVGRIARMAVARIALYHTWAYLGALAFPNFRFTYQDSPLRQAGGHIRRYLTQRTEARRSRAVLAQLQRDQKATFLAILQRPGDSQLLKHSSIKSVAAFIDMVVASFAAEAPCGARLVFKCHPLDPGLEDHRQTIMRRATALGVADRVFYVDGGYLPDMARTSAGLISVNSTAGLVGIEHGCPTLVLGSATYDMPGLTHQSGLATFWRAPEPPDLDLFEAFRRVVIANAQINGAYSTLRGVDLALPETVCRLLNA